MCFYVECVKQKLFSKICASVGNRPRIDCLEGNHADLHTPKKLFSKVCASAGNRTRIDCLEGNHADLYTTDAYVYQCLIYYIYQCTSKKPSGYNSYCQEIYKVIYSIGDESNTSYL